MRKIVVSIVVVLFFCVSCNEDFKVGASYKEVTAVYGILASNDTAHYIKVHKGFFSETEDNLIMAKNTDSTYYNNLEVKIEEVSNGNIISSTILTKVDLTNEGFPKDPGLFTTTPNTAYKFKKNLVSGFVYNLIVKNNTTGKIIKGSTEIIASDNNGFKVTTPSPSGQLSFGDFNGNNPFVWEMPNNAIVADVSLDFKYQELDITKFPLERKNFSKRIVLIEDVTASALNILDPINVKMSTKEFYTLASAACGSSPSNIKRYIDTPNLYITAATPGLKKYIDITNTSVGLTNDQIKPTFTTLVGENAIGIFASRATRNFINIKYNQKTIDLFINDALLDGLNFVDISDK
jgi:hypothetical protein